jgi:hypothetical protein
LGKLPTLSLALEWHRASPLFLPQVAGV